MLLLLVVDPAEPPAVAFEVSSYDVPEGGMLQACLVITNVPGGFPGLTVEISTITGMFAPSTLVFTQHDMACHALPIMYV